MSYKGRAGIAQVKGRGGGGGIISRKLLPQTSKVKLLFNSPAQEAFLKDLILHALGRSVSPPLIWEEEERKGCCSESRLSLSLSIKWSISDGVVVALLQHLLNQNLIKFSTLSIYPGTCMARTEKEEEEEWGAMRLDIRFYYV